MRELFTITGATPAEPRRWLRAGVPAAVGAGLLLFALAGCGQASPTVSRSQVPVMTIVPAAQSVTWGDPLQFRVRADRAPSVDLTVRVTIASSGCELAQSPTSVTLAAGDTAATLKVPTTGVEAGERGCAVTATVAPGEGYAVGSGASSRSATVVITPGENPRAAGGDPSSAEVPPQVTIEALATYVTVGGNLSFRLSADPAPDAPLTVNLEWEDPELVLSGTPLQTVTIPTSGTVDISAATKSDVGLGFDKVAPVWASVVAGTGYTIGTSRVRTTVRETDAPILVSIVAHPLRVNEGADVTFELTAVVPPLSALPVTLNWTDGHRFATTPPPTYTIPTSGNVSFSLATKNDLIDNYGADFVGVSIGGGNGYRIGWPATATITVVDDEYTPVVSVAAVSPSVTEGAAISYTLTAAPAPASTLTVNLGWEVGGPFFGNPRRTYHQIADPPDSFTIPTSSGTAATATVTVATTDDDIYTFPTTVKVTVLEGGRYFAPYATSMATITIENND